MASERVCIQPFVSRGKIIAPHTTKSLLEHAVHRAVSKPGTEVTLARENSGHYMTVSLKEDGNELLFKDTSGSAEEYDEEAKLFAGYARAEFKRVKTNGHPVKGTRMT